MLTREKFWEEFIARIGENIKFFPFIGSWTPFINSILFELGKELGYYTRFEFGRIRIDVCWLTKNRDIEIELAIEYENEPKTVCNVLKEVEKLKGLKKPKLKCVMFFVGEDKDEKKIKEKILLWNEKISKFLKTSGDLNKWFFIPFAYFSEGDNSRKVIFWIFSFDEDGNLKPMGKPEELIQPKDPFLSFWQREEL